MATGTETMNEKDRNDLLVGELRRRGVVCMYSKKPPPESTQILSKMAITLDASLSTIISTLALRISEGFKCILYCPSIEVTEHKAFPLKLFVAARFYIISVTIVG